MLDDVGDEPGIDAPDAESVYRNHVETCRRLGVEPVPRERARDLIAEWSGAIAGLRPALY